MVEFIRQNQRNDTDLGEFLEKSKETFKNTHKALKEIFRSAYFVRIYKMDSALKFVLLKGSYEEFEDAISRRFFNHFPKSIYLQTCFTDWLIYFLRPRFTSLEKLEFYRLLHVRSYSGREEIVNGQTYITVEFRLIDFMKVVDSKANTYQRADRKFRKLMKSSKISSIF